MQAMDSNMSFETGVPAVNENRYRTASEGGYSSGDKRAREVVESEMDSKYMLKTKKFHRLIEKRRRDRINKCIYQLKDLLPCQFIETTTKPMEKAVILELVVQYMHTLADNRRDDDNKEKNADFAEGYKSCFIRMLAHVGSMLGENQKKILMQQFRNEMPAELRTLADVQEPEPGINDVPSMVLNGSGDTSPLPRDRSTPEKKSTMPASSSSCCSSSSPTSDFSMGTDNSDSSSSNHAVQKVMKRKVYQHHRSTNSSSLTRHQPSKQGLFTTVAGTQNQMPVFVNLPVIMNPGMGIPAPQFVGTEANGSDNVSPVPCMVRPSPVQVSGGMVMPQAGTDMNCGVQFPTFVFVNPVQQADQPQVTNGQQKMVQNEPCILQPTMMMPVRNQGNYMCMPSFPMVPQFPGASFVTMQSSPSTVDQSSSSN